MQLVLALSVATTATIDCLWRIAPATVSPRYYRPLFLSPVRAGLPALAEDYPEGLISLDEHLVDDPLATFYVRVGGQSMENVGIHHGDILVVDRAASPHEGSVVVARLDGDFTVKRLRQHGSNVTLAPENAAFPPIEVGPNQDFEVWGVVTYVVHPLTHR